MPVEEVSFLEACFDVKATLKPFAKRLVDEMTRVKLDVKIKSEVKNEPRDSELAAIGIAAAV